MLLCREKFGREGVAIVSGCSGFDIMKQQFFKLNLLIDMQILCSNDLLRPT